MSLTTAQIVDVKVITGITNPIIVYVLNGHPDVARNLKQALTDLTNSGRAIGVTSTSDPRFINEVHKCRGAVLTGDLRVFKAGDTYEVTEGHPALTDKSHKAFGTVKIGDKLTAEKDGVWVEGFISIPRTNAELQREDIATNVASLIADFMGYGTSYAPVATAPVVEEFVPETVPAPPVLVPEVEGALGKPKK